VEGGGVRSGGGSGMERTVDQVFRGGDGHGLRAAEELDESQNELLGLGVEADFLDGDRRGLAAKHHPCAGGILYDVLDGGALLFCHHLDSIVEVNREPNGMAGVNAHRRSSAPGVGKFSGFFARAAGPAGQGGGVRSGVNERDEIGDDAAGAFRGLGVTIVFGCRLRACDGPVHGAELFDTFEELLEFMQKEKGCGCIHAFVVGNGPRNSQASLGVFLAQRLVAARRAMAERFWGLSAVWRAAFARRAMAVRSSGVRAAARARASSAAAEEVLDWRAIYLKGYTFLAEESKNYFFLDMLACVCENTFVVRC